MSETQTGCTRPRRRHVFPPPPPLSLSFSPRNEISRFNGRKGVEEANDDEKATTRSHLHGGTREMSQGLN